MKEVIESFQSYLPSEDFAYYLEKIKGCYFFIGVHQKV